MIKNITPSRAPIGIFDSGIGGLTVAKAVMNAMPEEHIIYFGDTARVPYGIKSVDTVRQYALQITDFLLEKGVKMVLIACNTVAASAEKEIKEKCNDIPVIGVIEAGTRAVHALQKHQKVGVIGTLATIGSGAYDRALTQMMPGISVFSRACPMLVPLAEEGWTDNSISEQVLQIYLEGVRAQNLDALILGCTHYPLFKEPIRRIVDGYGLSIIDSAEAIAEMAKTTLSDTDMLNPGKRGLLECYVTDKPQRFQELAERFLGKELNRVDIVSLK
ncbi:MAG: glutamate racemase [Balneolales bacterium]